jgi:hypothetical protein
VISFHNVRHIRPRRQTLSTSLVPRFGGTWLLGSFHIGLEMTSRPILARQCLTVLKDAAGLENMKFFYVLCLTILILFHLYCHQVGDSIIRRVSVDMGDALVVLQQPYESLKDNFVARWANDTLPSGPL